MNRVATDELDRVDEAFAGNRLLATFPREARALIEPFTDVIQLAPDSVVHPRGAKVESSYFPFGTAMVSLVVRLSGNRSLEVASIGHEGAVGGIVSCGYAPAFATAAVLVPGPALRVPMKQLEEAKLGSAHVGLWAEGRCLARHERSYVRFELVLDLEHYLDVLERKPGALAGSTAWRNVGRAGSGARATTRHGHT